MHRYCIIKFENQCFTEYEHGLWYKALGMYVSMCSGLGKSRSGLGAEFTGDPADQLASILNDTKVTAFLRPMNRASQ